MSLTNQQPTIDLAPFVDHIATLEDQVQRLTEATTMWQIRARPAEEQLKQLTAGDVSPDAPETIEEAPGSPQSQQVSQHRSMVETIVERLTDGH